MLSEATADHAQARLWQPKDKTYLCMWDMREYMCIHIRKVTTPSTDARPAKHQNRSDQTSISSLREQEKTWHTANKDGSKRARINVQLAKPLNYNLKAPTKLGPILSARFGATSSSSAAT